ncbi:MAG TPA: discoidin domain-containing protein [Gemmatimonadaceae bacterium]|nr:discoidin domain-containing protein [Gemmatimonadaceae bacterium]
MTVRNSLSVCAMITLVVGRSLGAQIIDKRGALARYEWLDNRDYDWYASRIPFFESPDTAITATYYYRWELVTKHLTYGDPRTGYTFTEFIDRPFWSGAYGAISCPLGHQFHELRWLDDPRIVNDFARYWFETPGAQPRSYSNWYGESMWATYLVNGDRAFMARVLPYMKRQYAGWVAEHFDSTHGMFHWDGLHDGMERNINSRQTDDIDTGAEGYRPTLNSYMYADALAISRASALLGDSASARDFKVRALTLKRRVQDELWDPEREFFFHEFAHDDKDGIRAGTLTYKSGPHAGNPHGRELIGYVPWQFELPDSAYSVAWRFLMDSARFYAAFGPTTTERHDPLFYISPRCCWWSGNSWPYATTQTLAAMANLLEDYHQSFVTKRDWNDLLRVYTRTQRRNGRPFIAEGANPDNGSWDGFNTFDHSEDYFHSGYVDLVITGLVGLRPRADDTLEVSPLAPEDWPWFALDDVAYHGHRVSVLWDRDGSRYGRGRGMTVLVDGRSVATEPTLGRLKVRIPPPRPHAAARMPVNLAVNNGRGAYPWVEASYSAATSPPIALIDGNYRYTTAPPNRWTDSGSVDSRARLVLDFGTVRSVDELTLYLLDDGATSSIRAPASYTIEMWVDGRWTRVATSSRQPATPQGHRANHARFAKPLRTSKIRLTMEHAPGAFVGLTEIEAWSREMPSRRDAIATPRDLAYRATGEAFPRASASFTGQSDAVRQAFDAQVAFTRYSRNRWTTYGSPNASDWLEVDFGAPRLVATVDLYLWGDERGVKAPRAVRVRYWDRSRWTDADVVNRQPDRPATRALNRIRLRPVRSSRIRVMFENDLPAASGVTELMVWGPDPFAIDR